MSIVMIVSLVAIVLYIWVRFQKITFGLAAVAALVHDVLCVVGAVAIAPEINLTREPRDYDPLGGVFKRNLKAWQAIDNRAFNRWIVHLIPDVVPFKSPQLIVRFLILRYPTFQNAICLQ